jgi:hypothetical protein
MCDVQVDHRAMTIVHSKDLSAGFGTAALEEDGGPGREPLLREISNDMNSHDNARCF